jgi:hypothetical protein
VKARIIPACVLTLLTVVLTRQTLAQAPPPDDKIVWGQVKGGLQLGIAPPMSADGVPEATFDSGTLSVRVYCRNTGKTPVRLLASVHTCLLGEGGKNALLVSELILTPAHGGEPVSVTYQGWNHLSLLDKRRTKDEQPQQTLNKSFGGKAVIQLSPEDAKQRTTVLAPGTTGPVADVEFAPWQQPRSWWWLKKEADTMTPGTYQVTAVLNVDHELSEWKGTLRSGSLQVEVRSPKKP